MTEQQPPPREPGGALRDHGEDGIHSRTSDAGSIKDSDSDAGSTATMNTSVSAGTLASGASTAFFSTQVHFFSLDDFAGHEIQTILEDGAEGEHEPPPEPTGPDDTVSVGGQSVRPGSIVSNIEQRLDDIEGFQGDPGADADHADGGSSAGSSAAHAAIAAYANLLEQMQHRELTPADLQLFMQLEAQAAAGGLSCSGAGSSSGGNSSGGGTGYSGGYGSYGSGRRYAGAASSSASQGVWFPSSLANNLSRLNLSQHATTQMLRGLAPPVPGPATAERQTDGALASQQQGGGGSGMSSEGSGSGKGGGDGGGEGSSSSPTRASPTEPEKR